MYTIINENDNNNNKNINPFAGILYILDYCNCKLGYMRHFSVFRSWFHLFVKKLGIFGFSSYG